MSFTQIRMPRFNRRQCHLKAVHNAGVVIGTPEPKPTPLPLHRPVLELINPRNALTVTIDGAIRIRVGAFKVGWAVAVGHE